MSSCNTSYFRLGKKTSIHFWRVDKSISMTSISFNEFSQESLVKHYQNSDEIIEVIALVSEITEIQISQKLHKISFLCV